jgi:hypothetical protein
MSEKLNVGDCIRVTKRGVSKGYGPGTRGSVLWKSDPGPDIPTYYVVRMEEDGPEGRPIVFLAEEIEADT